MAHLPFLVILRNGEITQLNQNGAAESTLNAAVEHLNATVFGSLFKASNVTAPG